MYRFPRETIDRLRALDQRTIRRALRRYLRRHQIRALMRRREILLEHVDRQLAVRDSSEVFFSLAAVTQ
jgi:predicted transcriptional regulator of viral defense system